MRELLSTPLLPLYSLLILYVTEGFCVRHTIYAYILLLPFFLWVFFPLCFSFLGVIKIGESVLRKKNKGELPSTYLSFSFLLLSCFIA